MGQTVGNHISRYRYPHLSAVDLVFVRSRVVHGSCVPVPEYNSTNVLITNNNNNKSLIVF
jgi:hypothetical protein